MRKTSLAPKENLAKTDKPTLREYLILLLMVVIGGLFAAWSLYQEVAPRLAS